MKTAQDTVAPFIKHFVEDRHRTASFFLIKFHVSPTLMSRMGTRKMKTRKANNHDVKKTHTGPFFFALISFNSFGYVLCIHAKPDEILYERKREGFRPTRVGELTLMIFMRRRDDDARLVCVMLLPYSIFQLST